MPDVLAMQRNEPLWLGTDRGPVQVTAHHVLLEDWVRLVAGDGTRGAHLYDWSRVPIRPWKEEG
jgi:hypothetical protein